MQSGAMRIANEEAVAGDGVSIHEQKGDPSALKRRTDSCRGSPVDGLANLTTWRDGRLHHGRVTI